MPSEDYSAVRALKDSIRADMKAALRAGEKDRLAIIRMLLAAIQRRELDDRADLDDAGVLKLVDKLVRQGQESARQYADGGRDELAAKELAEVEVLKQYLPEPLSDGELDVLIEQVILDTGADSMRDMGKVMNAIRQQAQGRADMGAVGGRVKAKLAGR
ncbi:MAG: GatB/YqeY domain-containing protein [Gammaproteobacteria bacterium]